MPSSVKPKRPKDTAVISKVHEVSPTRILDRTDVAFLVRIE